MLFKTEECQYINIHNIDFIEKDKYSSGFLIKLIGCDTYFNVGSRDYYNIISILKSEGLVYEPATPNSNL